MDIAPRLQRPREAPRTGRAEVGVYAQVRRWLRARVASGRGEEWVSAQRLADECTRALGAYTSASVMGRCIRSLKSDIGVRYYKEKLGRWGAHTRNTVEYRMWDFHEIP
jgi:hypothetical protein